jgi:hypothetical protein
MIGLKRGWPITFLGLVLTVSAVQQDVTRFYETPLDGDGNIIRVFVIRIHWDVKLRQ